VVSDCPATPRFETGDLVLKLSLNKGSPERRETLGAEMRGP